jgi:hypothetical protein
VLRSGFAPLSQGLYDPPYNGVVTARQATAAPAGTDSMSHAAGTARSPARHIVGSVNRMDAPQRATRILNLCWRVSSLCG